MTAAGLGLINALEILERNPPQPWLRVPLRRALESLKEGSGVSDSLSRSGHWLSSFDVALIEAGEKSGRLPQCFELLSKYYSERSALVRQVIGFCIYPFFVFHFAVLIFPVNRFTDLILKGAVLPYVAQKVLVLAPIYGTAVLLYYSMQSTHGETWRAVLEGLLHRVPLLGHARRCLAIARLSVALEALINAGVTIIEAWDLAAAASGSPALRQIIREATPSWIEGLPPSETLATRREFPDAFASLYKTGELSGQLDDALRRSHAMYQDEGSRKMKAFVFGLAGILVGGVMLMAAYQIIQFWMGYFQQINNAINF